MEEDQNGNLKMTSPNYGGVRPGSGRPLGSMNQATIDRRQASKRMLARIIKKTDRLLNAQFNLAMGCAYLYKLEKTGADDKVKTKHILIKDQEEINQYLDGELNTDDYYYITTKTPDSKCIENLLDRAFGRPMQGIAFENPLEVNVYQGCSLDELQEYLKQIETYELNQFTEGKTENPGSDSFIGVQEE